MRSHHPDDSEMTWRDKDKDRSNNGSNGGGHSFRVVMPSETSALASDMSDEFGGTAKGWRRNIRQGPHNSFSFGGRHGGGDGKGKGNAVTSGAGADTRPGVDPTYPQNNRAPMMSPLAFEAPVTALPQAQQAQRQPLTPEMIEVIRAHMMRG